MKTRFCILANGPDGTLTALWNKIPRQTIITFISAIICGFFTHGFMFANKFLNHDDIGHLFGSDYGVASGRWLLPSMLKLDGAISMPWLIGIISLILLALVACITVSLLRIKTTASCILTAALITVFPTVGATFTYMFSADVYFLSLLFACLAVFLTVRYRFGMISGIVLIALSMGIYQSYFCTAAALFVLVLILEVLDGKSTPKVFAIRAGTFLATLGLGMGLYYAIVKITTQSTGLVDYMGLSTMGELSFAHLPRLTFNAYKSYHNLYNFSSPGISNLFLLIVVGLLILSTLVLGIKLLRSKKLKTWQLVVLVLLVVILPLAGTLIYIMSPGGVHHLMLYGMCFVLITPLAIYEYRLAHIKHETSRFFGMMSWVVLLSLAVLSFNYSVFTNEAYMKMQLTYEQTTAFSNRLTSAIQSNEDYDENITIVLLGRAFANVENSPSAQLIDIQLTGALDTESVINNYTYNIFLKNNMALPNPVIGSDANLSEALGENPTVQSMPDYPAEGSIALVDGYIVVRFSDWWKLYE